MILLLDANISWRLVNILKSYYEEVLHVDMIALPQPAKDTEIWYFARKNNAIIITNDNDFYKFSVFKGFPPKVVILRTGNQSNKYLKELLVSHKEDIKKLNESESYGVLEIF